MSLLVRGQLTNQKANKGSDDLYIKETAQFLSYNVLSRTMTHLNIFISILNKERQCYVNEWVVPKIPIGVITLVL